MESELDLMPVWKRLLDIVGVLVLAVALLPVIAVLALVILIVEGRPVFYISERMKTATEGFSLVKFRTMRTVAVDSGVSGGDKAARITRIGAFLRRSRLDEVPQLWNILKGDMSFVGPRPPLRVYVEDYPQLYGPVLRSRPGVTGLATLIYHRHEQRLLEACTSAAETDAVYRRACVPRKARLDLIYQAHQSPCFDIWIMFRTVFPKRRGKAGK
jgi:lipopolysaccharide/colanic/teichoic acid biosynthesis glycosyltransferase